ncbi:PepSY domain-containing protein [Variovorax sp. EL159]|uniref:PepSY-associated TM helix domain-containing protein n=1 Tax=Variovorax sp. EL159 TaxID=1566270 RepID=UPI002109094C|nr:PepSY-associated TM helix domain-containing protein [Variovorax sp. EL159]
MRVRQHFVRLHRWAGLVTAAFLLMAGLTGSLLAFEDSLEAWLNPALFVVDARPATSALDPFVLRERAQLAAPPQALVDTVILNRHDGRSLRFILSARIDPKTGQPFALDVDELFMNPYSAAVLGTRLWGASLFRRETAISFLYRLHYSLAMSAPWSARVLGAVGLLWTLNCLIGFGLTLPRRAPARSSTGSLPGWWRRWRSAWRVAPSGSVARLMLDLHRAPGLWLWPVLLVFAWSSVMLTLRDSVYRPVMSLGVVSQDLWAGVPSRPVPMAQPVLDWRAAHAAGRQALSTLAREKNFVVEAERDLRLDRAHGVYVYRVRSSLDIRDAAGATAVLIDADSGALRGFAGGGKGNVLEDWLGALHMARVFGTPYKLFVALLGLVVALLSATGVLMWVRRTRTRAAS